MEIKKHLQDIIAATAPGEKLQDRVTLCRRLDTTRTTLDKAIRELVDEGMLTSRKGSGTFVTSHLKFERAADASWCVIVPNITETIYNTLVSAIEHVAQQHNINVILCSSDNNFLRQERFIRRLFKSGVDGFIIVPVITNDPGENHRLYSELTVSEIPFVFCNRSVEGVNAPTVSSNDFYGGYIATKHLIAQGYRRIAFISPRRYVITYERCKGYMAAIMESGIEIDRRLICIPGVEELNYDFYGVMQKLLAENAIDAVFTFSDAGALKVAEAVEDAGLKISDDIGIIGCGNSPECRFHTTPISSVSGKTWEIGKKAAEVLFQRCCNQKSASGFEFYLFQPEVVVRESTRGPVRR